MEQRIIAEQTSTPSLYEHFFHLSCLGYPIGLRSRLIASIPIKCLERAANSMKRGGLTDVLYFVYFVITQRHLCIYMAVTR